MGDFTLLGNRPFELDSGLDLTTAVGTLVTAAGSADTKGSWVEIESAAGNTFSSDVLKICLYDAGTTDDSYLVDIAIGGAGSEEVIIENLFFLSGAATTTGGAFDVYEFPVTIPSGERIAARLQASTASSTLNVSIIRGAPSFDQSDSTTGVITIGADTVNTAGVTVTSADNAYGSWTEITSSLSDSIKGFCVGALHAPVSSYTGGAISYQVGVGSAGNEEIVSSGNITRQSSGETAFKPASAFIGVGIASGERIAIRAVSSASNGDFDLDYIIYGVL